MRRRTLVLSLVLAATIGWLALLKTSVAAASDWTVLRTMPLSAAIRGGLRHDRLWPETAEPARAPAGQATTKSPPWDTIFSAGSLARIEAAPADLRTLAWLAYLADQPLSDGSDGSNGDGLHKFFYLWDGQLAPQVAEALRQAGFDRKAAIFAQAMAMFGDPYPTNDPARAPHFAWNGPRVHVGQYETIVPDLNAFDERLMALGRQFGPMHALWPDIQSWSSGRPALAGWLDVARAGVTDKDRMDWLLGQLELRMAPSVDVLAGAPHAYATLYAANLFNAEMLNGSVEQFFSNSSGNIAPEVVGALQEIGLDRHAGVVQRGMALYSPPYSRDRTVRLRASEAMPGLPKALDDLTGGVDDGAISPALLAYARRQDVLPH